MNNESPEMFLLSPFSCQVTDMLVANSHNLIVTVKPANQRNNVVHRGSRNNWPIPDSQNNSTAARY